VRWSRSSQGCIGWQARSASGGACVARRCRSAMEHLQKWHNSKWETVSCFPELEVLDSVPERLRETDPGTEWSRLLVQDGISLRPYAKGQCWGRWIHEAPVAVAEETGVAVSTRDPHALMDELEDMLVDVGADPIIRERQTPYSVSRATWNPRCLSLCQRMLRTYSGMGCVSGAHCAIVARELASTDSPSSRSHGIARCKKSGLATRRLGRTHGSRRGRLERLACARTSSGLSEEHTVQCCTAEGSATRTRTQWPLAKGE